MRSWPASGSASRDERLMEWVIVVVLALGAAAFIAAPWRRATERADGAAAIEALREEREMMHAELRELDDDAAAGRISSEDRLQGRRALAPRLRAVTEALQRAGEDVERS